MRQRGETFPGPAAQQASAGPAPTEQIDLATIMNVQRLISSEIDPDKLSLTLLRLAMEQAGAERGLLIFSRGDEPRIKAIARTSAASIAVELCDLPVEASSLAEAVFRHVVRSSETVILDEANADPAFSSDPYIRQHRAYSVLCVPLLNRSQLTGVLYFDNTESPAVFSSMYTTALKLLASQAAIALDNALLYRDLAERTAKISTSEARFRTFVDKALDAFFLFDERGTVLDVNREACVSLGYSRDELIGKRPTDFAIGFKDALRDGLTRRVHIGETISFETCHRRKDGITFPVEVRLTQFEQEGQRYLGSARDITERKRAEEALRRSEAYLSEAQRLTNSGAFAFNAKESLYWSDELFRIWGYDPQQGIPSPETWIGRVHPDDRARVWHEMQHALGIIDPSNTKTHYLVEYRIVLPDGTLKYMRSIGHPFYTASGELVEVFGTTIDVTERMRAQQQQEQLRQLEADLAHLNRLCIMGELTASLAHEILQPIATARNNARAGMRFLALSPPDLDEANEALSCVVRDTDRANDIVARIRDHVKKEPPRKQLMDLKAAINEVIVMVRSPIERNGISVRTQFRERPISVQGDRVQLQQVVLNLTMNAVEAMSSTERGPRELSISADLADAGSVLVGVRDSGPGIDPERAGLLFKPFHTTKPAGMGMGLSICRSIIDAHGGRLWAEPNSPRGAAFQFILPIDMEGHEVSAPNLHN